MNIWVGCSKVSEGCRNCYAEVSTPVRVKRAAGLEVWGPRAMRSETKGWAANLRSYARRAVREGRRRRVFAQSLSDTFERRDDPCVVRADGSTGTLDDLRRKFFDAIDALDEMMPNGPVIHDAPLDLLLLTKRPENIMDMVPAHWRTAWPSYVWIGCTVESQAMAEERIPHLLRVPAAVRFLSVEPQIKAVDLDAWIGDEACMNDAGWGPAPPWIQWVIQGGESGPHARPFDLAWPRSMRDQCRAAGVAYFLKQVGARPVSTPYKLTYGPLADSHGADESEWPADLRGCQAFPKTADLDPVGIEPHPRSMRQAYAALTPRERAMLANAAEAREMAAIGLA